MGAVFALFSGWYFWIPKILGLDYNLLYSKAHFWVLFAGVNLTFFPQHFLGLQGMPRRVSDYPDAFTGWNFISSIGSIISVAATALFLQIVYLQLVKGKAVYGYPWGVPQLFSDYLRILKDKCAPGLEWALHSPPKPHAFTSLPLQSVQDIMGIIAEKASVVAAADCLHTVWLYQTVEIPEMGKRFVPDCDFNVSANGTKHTVTSASRTFAHCAHCHMVICANCNLSQSMMFFVTSFNIFPVLLSSIKKSFLSIFAITQLFSGYLCILKDKCAPGLEWALHSPPKPHAFASLPLQSANPWSNGSSLNQNGESRDNLSTESRDGDTESESSESSADIADLAEKNETTLEIIEGYKEDLNFLRDIKTLAAKVESGTASDEERRVLRDAAQDSRLDSLNGINTPTVQDIKNEMDDVKQAIKDNIGDLEHNHYGGNITDGDSDTENYLMPIVGFPVISILIALYRIATHPVTKLYFFLHKDTITSRLIVFLSFIAIMLAILDSYSNNFISCDAPRAWGLYFQDSASPQMEALVELHDNIMYYLVAILLAVAWIQAAIIRNFESSKSPISNKYLNHGTLIELIWTITPALISVLIAFPSFKLLYLMDEVTDPSLSVLAEGHQWYW